MEASHKACFVIMPFGGRFDSYYEKIYKPAIVSAKLESKRADDLNRPSTIIGDIWEAIVSSTLVLADITGLNPNVMYELGLAHAAAKPAIILSNDIDTVPFDLRSLRIILYDIEQTDWAHRLMNKIERAIQETIASPLETVLPAFLSVNNNKKQEVTKVELELIEIKQMLQRQNSILAPLKEDTKKRWPASTIREPAAAAHDMYYTEGYDLGEIRQVLEDDYGLSPRSAEYLVQRLRSGSSNRL